jgi:hypothetical protein
MVVGEGNKLLWNYDVDEMRVWMESTKNLKLSGF